MISIIIPAHNEEKRLQETRILEKYVEFLRNKRDLGEMGEFELLIVLNACRDRTREIVELAAKKYREIKFIEFERGGKGFAIVEGFKHVLNRADLIGFVDADMATPPNAFYGLIRNIGNNAGIMASRWMPGSRIKKQPLMRIITSRVFNFVVKTVLLLPYIDTQCGAKLFTKKSLEKVIEKIKTTGWGFDIDLIYNLRKVGRVIEIPTEWNDNKDSKLNIKKVPLLMFLSVIRVRLLNSPLKNIISSYDRLPEWMKMHHTLR